MEKLRKRQNRISTLKIIMPVNIRKDSMMFVIWHSLRNAGLIKDLSKGGIHWAANVAIVALLTTTAMQVVALVLANEPERLFECFSVLSFCGMGVIKLYSLRRYREHWRLLLNEILKLEIEELNDEQNPPIIEYDSDNDDNFTVTSYIGRYTKSFNATHTVLTRLYTFTAIVFVISPFVEFGLWRYNGQVVESYPHILPMWTPLDAISFFGYFLTILLETLSSVYCVCVHVAFDLSTVGLMMFLHGQFSLLYAVSERIGGSGNLRTTQLISLLQYLGATMTQLFLYCNYGDAVLNESAVGMGKGPQGTAWWALSPRVRRELLLLILGMSQRYQLYAGPFFSVDLPTFIQIVRAAYSYYAVLRRKAN